MGTGYLFQNRTCNTADELAAAMAADWEEGKKALFSGSVRAWAQQSARDIYYLALAAENSRKKTPEREEFIYFRWLYKSAQLKEFYWKGICYGTALQVASLLEAGTVPALEDIVSLLACQGLFSLFLAAAGTDDKNCRQAELVERLLRRKGSRIPASQAGQLMAGILLPEKSLLFDGDVFSSVEELSQRLQQYADLKGDALEKKSEELYTKEGGMRPDFLIWLLKKGQEKAVISWHSRFQPASEDGLSISEEWPGSSEAELPEAKEPTVGHIPSLKKPSKGGFCGSVTA